MRGVSVLPAALRYPLLQQLERVEERARFVGGSVVLFGYHHQIVEFAVGDTQLHGNHGISFVVVIKERATRITIQFYRLRRKHLNFRKVLFPQFHRTVQRGVEACAIGCCRCRAVGIAHFKQFELIYCETGRFPAYKIAGLFAKSGQFVFLSFFHRGRHRNSEIAFLTYIGFPFVVFATAGRQDNS